MSSRNWRLDLTDVRSTLSAASRLFEHLRVVRQVKRPHSWPIACILAYFSNWGHCKRTLQFLSPACSKPQLYWCDFYNYHPASMDPHWAGSSRAWRIESRLYRESQEPEIQQQMLSMSMGVFCKETKKWKNYDVGTKQRLRRDRKRQVNLRINSYWELIPSSNLR